MRIFLVAVVGLCIIVLTSCSASTLVTEGPAPGVMVDSSKAPHAGLRLNSVAILDKSLQRWYVYEKSGEEAVEHGKVGKIAVEGTGARRSPTGTVEVWAILRNRTDFPLQIEGRVQFFAKDKAPLEGPSAWQRIVLHPNSITNFKEFSTNVEDVGYYYVEIREGM